MSYGDFIEHLGLKGKEHIWKLCNIYLQCCHKTPHCHRNAAQLHDLSNVKVFLNMKIGKMW